MTLTNKFSFGFALLAAGLIMTVLSVSNAAETNEETILHFFAGGVSDGSSPYGSLIADGNGNLYGTTAGGGSGTECGSGTQGCGTVFKITPDNQEIVLYAFAGGDDGTYPRTGLVLDDEGNLYGTTSEGGTSDLGTVFKLLPMALRLPFIPSPAEAMAAARLAIL